MSTPTKLRTYQGYSTISGTLTTLYDIDLVNQDLMNNFMTKKGEVMTDPSYGSIIWSMLFEPASDENIRIMKNDTMTIFQNEKRVTVVSFDITASTSSTIKGYTLSAVLNYNGLNVSRGFKVNFFNSLVDTGE